MRLTVVIFNYNYAHFLDQALASVWQQTRRPDRVVVSDDRSPNNTPEELAAIVARHPGTELVVNEKNLGNIAHYRARVAEIDSEVYFQLSADDYLVDLRFFEGAMAALEADGGVTCVFGYHLPVDNDGRALLQRNVRLQRDATRLSSADLRRELAFENNLPAVCMVIRTRVHERVPPFALDNRHCGDWQQWYMLAPLGAMVRLERVVLAYRVHGGNMSTTLEAEGRAHQLVLEAYDQMLALPDLEPADRHLLQLGRRRHAIRSATIRALPAEALRQPWDGDTAAMVAEAVLERVGRHAEAWRERLTARFLGARVTRL